MTSYLAGRGVNSLAFAFSENSLALGFNVETFFDKSFDVVAGVVWG